MKSWARSEEEVRSWIPPDGLDRCRPRRIRLTAAGKCVMLLAWLLLGGAITGGVLVGLVVDREANEAKLLARESVVTEGLVTRRWRRGKRNREMWISYTFPVGDRFYGRTARIPSQLWSSLQTGMSIPVHYVPSRPDLNYPLDVKDRPVTPLAPYFVGIGLAAAGLLVIFMVRRQSWFLAEGRAAPGRVTGIVHRKRGHRGEQRVYFDFVLLNGSVTSGSSSFSKNPPAVGSRVTVLYDPARPGRSVLYPCALVQLVDRRPLR
jgi:hypothetical protein